MNRANSPEFQPPNLEQETGEQDHAKEAMETFDALDRAAKVQVGNTMSGIERDRDEALRRAREQGGDTSTVDANYKKLRDAAKKNESGFLGKLKRMAVTLWDSGVEAVPLDYGEERKKDSPKYRKTGAQERLKETKDPETGEVSYETHQEDPHDRYKGRQMAKMISKMDRAATKQERDKHKKEHGKLSKEDLQEMNEIMSLAGVGAAQTVQSTRKRPGRRLASGRRRRARRTYEKTPAKQTQNPHEGQKAVWDHLVTTRNKPRSEELRAYMQDIPWLKKMMDVIDEHREGEEAYKAQEDLEQGVNAYESLSETDKKEYETLAEFNRQGAGEDENTAKRAKKIGLSTGREAIIAYLKENKEDSPISNELRAYVRDIPWVKSAIDEVYGPSKDAEEPSIEADPVGDKLREIGDKNEAYAKLNRGNRELLTRIAAIHNQEGAKTLQIFLQHEKQKSPLSKELLAYIKYIPELQKIVKEVYPPEKSPTDNVKEAMASLEESQRRDRELKNLADAAEEAERTGEQEEDRRETNVGAENNSGSENENENEVEGDEVDDQGDNDPEPIAGELGTLLGELKNQLPEEKRALEERLAARGAKAAVEIKEKRIESRVQKGDFEISYTIITSGGQTILELSPVIPTDGIEGDGIEAFQALLEMDLPAEDGYVAKKVTNVGEPLRVTFSDSTTPENIDTLIKSKEESLTPLFDLIDASGTIENDLDFDFTKEKETAEPKDETQTHDEGDERGGETKEKIHQEFQRLHELFTSEASVPMKKLKAEFEDTNDMYEMVTRLMRELDEKIADEIDNEGEDVAKKLGADSILDENPNIVSILEKTIDEESAGDTTVSASPRTQLLWLYESIHDAGLLEE